MWKPPHKKTTTASWNFHTQAWLWLLYDCCTLTYHWLCSFHWVCGVFQLLMVGRCNSSLFESGLSPVDAAVVSLWLILALLFSHLSQRFREQKLLIQDKKRKRKIPIAFENVWKGGENAEKPTRFSPSWRNEAPFLLDMSADNSKLQFVDFNLFSQNRPSSWSWVNSHLFQFG